MDAQQCIDLIKVFENGTADWVGRVATVEEAQPRLNQLSASSEDHFLAIDRSTRAVVAHVVGKTSSTR